MKNAKRMASLVLVLALIAGFGVPFAAAEDGELAFFCELSTTPTHVNTETQKGWGTNGYDGISTPYSISDFMSAEYLVLEFAEPISYFQLIWQGDGGGWAWNQSNFDFDVPQSRVEISFRDELIGPNQYYQCNSVKILLAYYSNVWEDMQITRAYLCSDLTVPVPDPPGPSILPDPAFEAAVREIIGKPTGEILPSDVENVSSLNIGGRGICDLTGIEYFTALEYLYCSGNQLTEVDLTNNPLLTYINIGDNKITSVDLSNQNLLETLHVYNNQLTSLVVPDNPNLVELNGSDNQISELDLGDVPQLELLWLYKNALTSLDVTGNNKLKQLVCYLNQLTELIVPDCPDLWELNCGANQISTLIIGDAPMLRVMHVDANQLETLDVSRFALLERLHCYSNQLTELDVSHNPVLTQLDCRYNYLPSQSAVIGLDESVTTEFAFYPQKHTPGPRKLSGRLTLDGEPLPDTIVRLLVPTENGYTAVEKTITDADGFYNFPSLIDGNYAIYIPARSQWKAHTSESFDTNGADIVIDLDMERDTEPFFLELSTTPTHVNGDSANQKGWGSSESNGIETPYTIEDFMCAEYLVLEFAKPIDFLHIIWQSSEDGWIWHQSDYMPAEPQSRIVITLREDINDPEQYYQCVDNVMLLLGYWGGVWEDMGLTRAYLCSDLTAPVPDPPSSSIFPDPAFEAAVREAIGKPTGEILPSDVEGIMNISLSGRGIKDLTGIHYFTGLVALWCDDNQITELDMSNNPALELLNISNNQLVSLDISGNPALEYLYCENNQLTELDLSGNPALVSVYSDNNQFARLDLSGNPMLQKITCHNNQLTELISSGCVALEYLYCSSNQLTELDLSENPALEYLYCENNQLTELDLSGNPALKTLSFHNNQLSELDLSGNPVLDYLVCGRNQLTELNLSGNPALTSLSCEDNQLTELDLSGNPALEYLACGDNQITGLDLSANPVLQHLYCGSNQIAELNLTGNPVLSWLLCFNNQLTELDLSGNPELLRLWCDSNQLTELDVSGNPALDALSFVDNQLTALDISENLVLRTLDCRHNYFTSVDDIIGLDPSITTEFYFDPQREIPCTVTFRDYDGRILKTQILSPGEAAEAPEAPTRTGYTFTGWDRDFTVVTSNLTVFAKYKVNSHSVTFVLDNGEPDVVRENIQHGYPAVAPPAPMKDGYAFEGWDKDFSKVASDLTVTALYRETSTFTVVFKDYDGTILKTQTDIPEGGTAVAPANPAKPGYVFDGWDKPLTNIMSNQSITARYAKAASGVEYIESSGTYNLENNAFTGDYVISASNVTVQSMNLKGNLYIYANDVIIQNGSIQGNVFIMGKDVTIQSISIQGNVSIHAPEVTIKNGSISGDLTVEKTVGDGEVTLRGLSVGGTIRVYGGGGNSVIMESVDVKALEVDKAADAGSQAVSIKTSGETKIGSAVIKSSVNLIDNTTTNNAVGTVELRSDIPEGASVTLDGSFTEVVVSASSISVELSENTVVENLEVLSNAENVAFQGGGDVNNANVSEDASETITFANDPVEVQSYVRGDANGDGLVTLADAIAIAQYIAAWDVTINKSAAKVTTNADGSNTITLADAIWIAQKVAGWFQ